MGERIGHPLGVMPSVLAAPGHGPDSAILEAVSGWGA